MSLAAKKTVGGGNDDRIGGERVEWLGGATATATLDAGGRPASLVPEGECGKAVAQPPGGGPNGAHGVAAPARQVSSEAAWVSAVDGGAAASAATAIGNSRGGGAGAEAGARDADGHLVDVPSVGGCGTVADGRVGGRGGTVAMGVPGAMPPATPRAVRLSARPPHPCEHGAPATVAESRLVVRLRQWRRHATAARGLPRLRRRVAHGTHRRWCVGGGEREQGHRENGERRRH